MSEESKVIIIAGPNGAGKTTFAREFLPNEAGCPIFVNADLIAAGLAPFAPESAAVPAGRVMLGELGRHFAARHSFAFETTLSGRAYLRHIHEWQTAGYRVKLIFLQLNDGRKIFTALYAPLVDAWALYDNSGSQPALLDWSEKP